MDIHKYNRAVDFAEQVHHEKKRKGKEVPYIVHPMAVVMLLMLAGAEESVVVAGVLHDTIEDCDPYGSVTRELLAELFGEDVARMVDDVTEQDKTLSWPERKEVDGLFLI